MAIDSKFEAGIGCRSNSSIGGLNFEGSIIVLKERGNILSWQTHLSDMTLI